MFMKKCLLAILLLLIAFESHAQSIRIAKSISERDTLTNYEDFLFKIDKAVNNIESYRVKSHTTANGAESFVLLEFVKPSTQRQTFTSKAIKETNIHVKDKHYRLIPGTAEWKEESWQEGAEPIRKLGVLEQMIEIIKGKIPLDITLESVDGVDYIVFNYENIEDWGNIYLVYSNYKSNIRFYFDLDSYFLKLAIAEMSGSHLESGKKLDITQIKKFSSYNESMNIVIPEPNNLIVSKPVPEEIPEKVPEEKIETVSLGVSNLLPSITKEELKKLKKIVPISGTNIYDIKIPLILEKE